MAVVFVTGADRGLGAGIACACLRRGHRVFAGQFMPDWPELAGMQRQFTDRLTLVPLDVGSPESIKAAVKMVEKVGNAPLDVLVNNAGVIGRQEEAHIRDGQNYESIRAQYEINALGPLRVTEAFLPLMDRGGAKRLCFVSSEAGSLGACYRKNWFGYCMSKSALNMAVSILFNDLRGDGYTFRLFHPGWVRSYMLGKKNEEAAYEPDEAGEAAADYFLSENGTYDEDKLVLRDITGKEWPW